MKNLLMAALIVLGTGAMTFAQTGQQKTTPAKEVKSEKHVKKVILKETKAEVKADAKAEAKKSTAAAKSLTPAKKEVKEVKAVKTTITK